ncbi:MAG: hypothetical protein SNJ64_06690, partial [Endomicrobiia bacterium]
MRLPNTASTGLSIFDYEKTIDYRIFIPMMDNTISVFDITGKQIKGWMFSKTDSPVKSPIQHFVIDKKDYLIFNDKNTVYILNRRGEIRVKVKENFQKSYNMFYIDKFPKTNAPCFVCTDIEGKLKYISTEGEVQTVTIDNFSNSHYFQSDDIDNDGGNDYIFADNKTLTVFNTNKKKIYSYSISQPISENPVIYTFSSTDKKIGIVDSKTSELYLINPDGSIYKGFPLKGNTKFPIL